MIDLDSMVEYARSFLGTRYTFGGANRLTGLDCSQFCTELLISRGLLPHGSDLTAQALMIFMENQQAKLCQPQKGAFAFFGKDADHITHVGFCIDNLVMIEAGGGTSDTDTLEEAMARGAMVRERPAKYRKDYFCSFLPNY